MTCFNLALKSAFVKKFIFVLATHYNDTDSENIKTVEYDGLENVEYIVNDYNVIMFSAEKKNTIKIWGYREV